VTNMPPVPDEHWFNPPAAFVGDAYLRNAFTTGSVRKIAPKRPICVA
jgi:hypothetical protein